MNDGGMNLESLMHMLGLGGGMGADPFTLGPNAYYGGLDRQPYQADPNMMPPMMDPAMQSMEGIPPEMGGMTADPLGMGQADPSQMMQMLGGLGLG